MSYSGLSGLKAFSVRTWNWRGSPSDLLELEDLAASIIEAAHESRCRY